MLKRNVTAIVLIIAMCFALSACTKEPKPEPVDPLSGPVTLSIDAASLPVIDGALACLPYYEETVSLVTGLPIEEARTYVLANNTPASFRELAEGKIDIGFLLHASAEQEEYAESYGVTFEYAPYAKDAFVFFVNKENPVESLTMQQLKDIYAGRITNWKEVGGRDEPIIAYQRNEGSGSQTGLYQYVISPDEVMEPPTETRIADMGGIIDAVARYENASGALGYSYLYFVTNQHYDEDIKLLRVDGYAPDETNIRSGKYPMVTEYCLVTREGEATEGSYIRQLIDWCLSDQGQALAKKLSYVPVTENGAPFVQPALPEMIRGELHAPVLVAEKNPLTATDINYESNGRSGSYVQIDGLADEAVELAINRAIRNTFFDLLEDDSVPPYRGSSIMAKRIENLSHDGAYAYAAVGANSDNILSVYVNTNRYYQPADGEYFSMGRVAGLTFDLRTGEQLKITDLFADPEEGLKYLNGKVQTLIEENATDENNEREWYWYDEGASPFLLSGTFPGLTEDQPYYLTESNTINLIFDETTPWAKNDSFYPQMITLQTLGGTDFSRFRTDTALFEGGTPTKRLLWNGYPESELAGDHEGVSDLYGQKNSYYFLDVTYYKSMPEGQLAALPLTEEERLAFLERAKEAYDRFGDDYPERNISASIYGYVSRVGDFTNVTNYKSYTVIDNTNNAYNLITSEYDNVVSVFRGSSAVPLELKDIFRSGVDPIETLKEASRSVFMDQLAENYADRYDKEYLAYISDSFDAFLDDCFSGELSFSIGTEELSLIARKADVSNLARGYSVDDTITWLYSSAVSWLSYDAIGQDKLALFD